MEADHTCILESSLDHVSDRVQNEHGQAVNRGQDVDNEALTMFSDHVRPLPEHVVRHGRHPLGGDPVTAFDKRPNNAILSRSSSR